MALRKPLPPFPFVAYRTSFQGVPIAVTVTGRSRSGKDLEYAGHMAYAKKDLYATEAEAFTAGAAYLLHRRHGIEKDLSRQAQLEAAYVQAWSEFNERNS